MIKNINGRDRIFYLDEIRALAIILVILCHVLREFCQIRPLGSLGWSFCAVCGHCMSGCGERNVKNFFRGCSSVRPCTECIPFQR